jgi:hypothetical protein
MLHRLGDVFACLQRHDVKYLVMGGIAAVLYGVPRATFDLDLLIEATPGNAQRLLAAFTDARLGTAGLITEHELLANEITIFKDRVRIDVQTRTPGIVFAECWERRETLAYGGQSFFVLAKQDLIAAKRAAGRPVDLEDVRLLQLPDDPPPAADRQGPRT